MSSELATRQLVSSRYQIIDRIGAGGMGIVFRALDRLTGQTVALKQVTAPGEQLEFASSGASIDYRLALAQEFKTLSSLRHPNIISVLDYGFNAERQPYYTMELLEGSMPIIDAATGLSNEGRIDLLVQTLQALAYLHRRGIIHRDLKPDNVVVINNQVKVLDFGLAVARKYMPEESGVIGTIAYMAPEVLRSGPASELSDLYAVGVIGYELFAGRHPFDVNDVARLVRDVLTQMPDFSRLDVEPGILAVLMRLMAKTPTDRYMSAREAIEECAIVTGKDLDLESENIRESYLQAAQFVGREKEIAQLTSALYDIVPQRGGGATANPTPRGSIWLVEGESGVGKSRLLDELRAQALVAGALVVRGQAVEQGGVSYQIWRNALRYLCLQTELTDIEASVLKPLVTDIESLIGRPVAPAPDVDPQAAQARLLSVIESTFLRQTQPIVLLLEDLHWATEGLQIIKLLGRNIDRHPLLIVGSYRSDEAPNLADDFLEAELITLDRLSDDEIARLSESMLGSVGRQPDVLEFLERETEGNVFFIVEVVRALAEEAGQLEQIGRMTLPESVFARGMRAIIQHRLNRLPESALLLLQVAAIGGRELDLNVLPLVPSEMDFGDWLYVCEMETVLEIVDNHWRFVHDKLREQLLDDLADEARAALHQYYAEALEQVYGGDPEMTMTLAHHWQIAGVQQKVAYYTAVAGDQALEMSAYDRAVQYLERALELEPSREKQALIERQLAEASYGLGRVQESLLHTRQALRLMNTPSVPSAPSQLRLRLLQQILRQVAHRVLPSFFMGRNADDSERLLTLAMLHSQAAQSYLLLGEARAGLLSALFSLNIAEKARPSSELAYTYGALALICQIMGSSSITRYYLRHSRDMIKQVGESRTQVYAMALHAYASALLGFGDFDEAAEVDGKALEIFEEIGDQRRWNEACANLAFIQSSQGRFDEAFVSRFDLLVAAQRADLLYDEVIALEGMIQLTIRAGRLEETQTYLSERFGLIQAVEGVSIDAGSSYFEALLHYRLGDKDAARRHLPLALKQLRALGYKRPHDFYAYFNTVEVAMNFRELEGKSFQPVVDEALAMAAEFARIFPFARPRYQTWMAHLAWYEAKHTQAIRLWNQAIEAARALNLPYDEAIAQFHIGTHLPANDPLRAAHLLRAVEVFEACGAAWDLEQARAALAATS